MSNIFVRIQSRVCLILLIACSPVVLAEKVALTFDDLPLNGELAPQSNEAEIAERVIAILKKNGAPPVFGFLNASKLAGKPQGVDALRLWIAAGERVGNHTYSHVDLHQTDVPRFVADLEKNESTLQTLAPSVNWRWFRYPFLREGETLEKRRAVRAYLQERHYAIAQVTLDYEDYLWNTPYARCTAKSDRPAIQWLHESYLQIASDYIDADRQMATLIFMRPIDHVLLLHLGAFSEQILPDLLMLLKKKGFVLATLEEVQADSAYQADPDAASRYGGTLLEQLMDARKIPYPKITQKPVKKLESLCR